MLRCAPLFFYPYLRAEMSRPALDSSPWAFRALYLFAFVLIVMPALDLVTTVLPARPGDFSWRYGAFGLMAG